MIMTISDPAAVFRSGLRPGDILVDLDGRPLEPARMKGLGDELSLADSLEVTYQRDGQIRKRVIDLTR
jgi:general secretion pathway protein C